MEFPFVVFQETKMLKKLGETVKNFILGQLNLNNRPRDHITHTPNSQDRQLTLEPDPNSIGTPPLNPHPEQLNSEPRQRTTGPDGVIPKEDLGNEQMNQRLDKEDPGSASQYPFNTQVPMNPNNIHEPMKSNPTNLKPYPNNKFEDQEGKFPFENTMSAMLTVEDVKQLNPVLGSKMEKLGIKFVDKSMFEKEYNALYTKCLKVAAQRKVPVSEVFEEVL